MTSGFFWCGGPGPANTGLGVLSQYIFIYIGTMDFEKATHMGSAEHLYICRMKDLFAPLTWRGICLHPLYSPMNFWSLTETFMEEILQWHIFADNALNLFALEDVWQLLELKILRSSDKSAFSFFLLMLMP